MIFGWKLQIFEISPNFCYFLPQNADVFVNFGQKIFFGIFSKISNDWLVLALRSPF